MTILCGIDFGTSNSTIAIVRDGVTTLVPLENGSTTIPSAIFYPSEGGAAVYGRAAIAAYTSGEPGRLMRSLKSILGSDLITERTAVGGRMLTFEMILVGFVSYLKRNAEAFAGGRIDDVVMGRPVHFVDGNEEIDARAEAKLGEIAEAAGFSRIAFQFEPIAAALQFEHDLDRDELVFIADIGGGTADFSMVAVGPKRRGRSDRSGDILANDGIRVGGTNLDMRLSMAAVMPQLGSEARTLTGLAMPRWPFVDLATWHRIHTIATQKNLNTFRQMVADCAQPELFERYVEVIRQQTGHLIAAGVERAKVELSAAEHVVIDIGHVGPDITTSVAVDRGQFEASIAGELERLSTAVAATLSQSGKKAAAVTTVFLTGGTSAVPSVRQAIVSAFPKARTIEGDLFNSVGFGLALDARSRFAV